MITFAISDTKKTIYGETYYIVVDCYIGRDFFHYRRIRRKRRYGEKRDGIGYGIQLDVPLSICRYCSICSCSFTFYY